MKKYLTLTAFLFLYTFLFSQTYDWISPLNGHNVQAAMMSLDDNNNLFVAGEFSDTLDADPGAGVYELIDAPSGYDDSFLIRFDALGNFSWAISFGADGFLIKEMVNGPDGSIYLAGDINLANTTVDVDPGEGVFELVVDNMRSPFIIKLDSAGEFQWAQNFDGSGNSYLDLLAVDENGTVYIGGSFMDTVDFDYSEGVEELSADGLDSFLLQLSPDGEFVSVGHFTGPGSEHLSDMCFGPSGDIYISGHYATNSDSPDLDPGPGVYIAPFADGANLFILKLNASGELDWLSTANGSSTQEIYDIDVDDEGNVYATGIFSHTVDFDPGPGEYILNYIPAYFDMYVWKLDVDGNLVYANAYGNWGSENGNSVVVDAEGHAFVTGNAQADIDLDPGPGVEILPNAGQWDIFLFEFSPGGSLLNYATMGNDASNRGLQLIYDEENLYMMGWYRDTLDVDPGPAVHEIPGGNGWQSFISKYTPCVFSQAGMADLDNNGVADQADMDLLMSEFGCISNCQYDLNEDQIIGVHDVMLMIYYMNGGCTP